MKTALGMVTRKLSSTYPIKNFLNNASKYGHRISAVIIAYSHYINSDAISELEKLTKVHIFQINNFNNGYEDIKKLGLSRKSQEILMYCDTLPKCGLVPYGFNRNLVLMQAMLMGMDTLVFIDSDVEPCELYKDDKEIKKREVDFFGRHLIHLKKGASITTSEYTGFNILPPASFEGLKDLLIGVQKEKMYSLYEDSDNLTNLSFVTDFEVKPRSTNKVLGGNLGLKLEAFRELPPFYSSTYSVGGETLLARGEDTVIGYAAEEKKIPCVDIDTHIFHNTFGDYPKVPNLKRDLKIQERFFYACTGWIGRNPFFNWIMGNDLDSIYKRQYKHLKIGASALANYTANKRFMMLPKAFEKAWKQLDKNIELYDKTMEAWSEFVKGVV